VSAPHPFSKTGNPTVFGWEIPGAYYEIFYPGASLACNLFHTPLEPGRENERGLLGPFPTLAQAAEAAVEHAQKLGLLETSRTKGE